MKRVVNLEVVSLKTVKGKLIATLSFQDLDRAADVNNGYGSVEVPVNLRELQKSRRGNVLVNQSKPSDDEAISFSNH